MVTYLGLLGALGVLTSIEVQMPCALPCNRLYRSPRRRRLLNAGVAMVTVKPPLFWGGN